MGINSRVFDLLATHCWRDDRDGRALIAGYPDMVVDAATLRKHLPGSLAIANDKQENRIQAVHGWDGPVADPHVVFRELGYRLTIIDIHAEHGEEEIVDLDLPQNGWLDYAFGAQKTYDLVVDHGTIEHCFNIGQAALTLVGAVAPDGWMVQHLPFSMANHGFYNINPTWFFDLYEANGFEIVHFEGWNLRSGLSFELPRHARFGGAPEDTLCTMIARRVKPMLPTMPMQRLYQR